MADLVHHELVKRFYKIFRGYTSRYGAFIIDKHASDQRKGRAQTLKGPITDIHYENHLNGTQSIGIIPLMDDGTKCVFGCISINKSDVDIDKLAKDSANLPVVLTTSKTGGVIIWLFMIEPTEASLVRNTLNEFAARLGFGKADIFPRQDKRITDSDAGNWVDLPYFGNTRKAYMYGKQGSLLEFIEFSESRMMNAETIESILASLRKGDMFLDGPPCLGALFKKKQSPSHRSTLLMNAGIYFKKKDPGNFLVNLLALNKDYLENPLPEAEIHATIAKTLQRKTGSYQCNVEPLCSTCNRSACLKRDYGVGGSTDELEIELSGLTKICTIPPSWFVNIDGVRVGLDDINQLINQQNMRSLAAENVHKLFSVVKKATWDRVVNSLLSSVEEIEAPDDSSFNGQIKAEVSEFILFYGSDEGIEVIANHGVFIDKDNNRAIFKSSDLVKKIRKSVGGMVSPQAIWKCLKWYDYFNAKSDEMIVCGKPEDVWSITIPDSAKKEPELTVTNKIGNKEQLPF